MPALAPGSPLNSLSQRLVEAGVIDESRAAAAQAEALRTRQPMAALIVERGWAPSADVLLAQAADLGMAMIDVGALDIARLPLSLVRDDLLSRHLALPVRRRGGRLAIVHADPTNTRAIEEIKFQANLAVDSLLAEPAALRAAIDRATTAAAIGEMQDDPGLDSAGDLEVDETAAASEDVSASEDEAPAVRFVNRAIIEAVRRGASDIHFEPYETEVRVRLRMDGVLRITNRTTAKLRDRIAARLKVLSQLDIAEKRLPQDGRMRVRIPPSREVDFRVSTCPTLYGEKIVLRLLDAAAARLGIDKLGYDDDQRDLYMAALAKPYGMILVTGPTGSGKTVSLYTGLNILNTEERNISTAEDPVEIRVTGINQVQMNPKKGMTFSLALRSFLRQDPDVIMVGEIRDPETAEIAVKAAQTGHLVLSTLHTNDAPKTIARLMSMGIAGYNITSAVSLVIAQRLVRRLHSCKKPVTLPVEALRTAGFTEEDIAAGMTLYEPGNCPECNDGYKGRLGVYQVMPMTEGIQRVILEGGNDMGIAAQAAREGIRDLRRSALIKVKQGITSLAEADRVTLID